jgi:hypothetical protein
MRDFFESIFGIIFGVTFALGAPATFVYLIQQDAETSLHSYFQWLGLITLDLIASATWFFYWPVHWLLSVIGC